jgi:hypothetical protein
MNRKCCVALASLFFIGSALAETSNVEQPRRTFPVGTYRQNGNCTKLTQGHIDRTSTCSPYVGVLSLEDDRPQFMFSREDGSAWFFVSSGPPVFSENNSVAVYPVSHIFDTETKAIFQLQGECKIAIGDHTEEIMCTTWREKERQKVAWMATFRGEGIWLYKAR